MTPRSTSVLIAFLLITLQPAIAQPDSSRWTFFPDRTLFAPLMANHEEPRMGIQQEIGSSTMKVAIGNSFEMFQYHSGTDTLRCSLLFFVYAQANDYRGFRLKIDAADGFFGLGFSFHTASPFSFRFRMIHLSAHLVDGHYNDLTQTWRDNKVPFPFSRNYGEALAAYSSSASAFPYRIGPRGV